MSTQVIKQVIIHVLWVASLIFFLFPLAWILIVSFKPILLAFEYPPVWLFKPTMKNYLGLQGSGYLGSLKNSAVVSAGTIILSLLIAVPAAYSIARRGLKLGSYLFGWTFLVRMVPGMVFIIPYFIAYKELGLIDTRIGLIVIYMIFNLALVLGSMTAYFSDIPREIEEAALVDGAGINQIFVKIALPLAAPGLAATAILCFLFSWNEFVWPLVLTRTAERTAPLAIMNFLRYEGTDWGSLSAGVVLLIIPVLVFSIVVRKYLVRGLTAGALKG